MTIVRFFRPSLYPVGPYLTAYLSWAALFALCMGLAVLLGYRLPGGDAQADTHRLGFMVAYFSPFGLPLLAGAPLVLVLDLAMSVSRWFISPRRRA